MIETPRANKSQTSSLGGPLFGVVADLNLRVRPKGALRQSILSRAHDPLVWAPTLGCFSTCYDTVTNHLQNTSPYFQSPSKKLRGLGNPLESRLLIEAFGSGIGFARCLYIWTPKVCKTVAHKTFQKSPQGHHSTCKSVWVQARLV